ncbi:MAG: RnfABCDGE type electron transport complex subunit D [Candidatus Marinimicrobia bacterium]|nr:RnfABCDGE type electron transport complex subunit D [Candidatus Neomarinimicrobiota bacterium]
MDTIKKHLPALYTSPFIRNAGSVPQIMFQVILALMPAVIAAIYYFRWDAVRLICASILAAMISEWLMNKLRKRESTLPDASAIITGLLLALTLPPSFSTSGAVLGSIFAITLGKHVFGGLGFNIFNPALFGRAFLQASFPVEITTFSPPATIITDAVTTATPLGLYKFEKIFTPYLDMLWGNTGGCIGETSSLLLLLGGLYLLIRKFADWRIPASIILGVVLFSGSLFLINPDNYADPVFHLLSGGMMLGIFFMATDMVTSPVTPRGTWIFGLIIAFIVIIIRVFGGLAEGMMYAILLANALVPLLNRTTRPRIFGEMK